MRLHHSSNPHIRLQRGLQSLRIGTELCTIYLPTDPAHRAHLHLDLSVHIIPTTQALRALGIVFACGNYRRHTHTAHTRTQPQPQAHTQADEGTRGRSFTTRWSDLIYPSLCLVPNRTSLPTAPKSPRGILRNASSEDANPFRTNLQVSLQRL